MSRQRQITISPGTPAQFRPNPENANADDNVFFSNQDTVAHWPTPQGAAPDFWFPERIEPRDTSDAVNMRKGSMTYVCSLHQHETGTIDAT